MAFHVYRHREPHLTALRRNQRTYQIGHFITSCLYRPSAGFRSQYARWVTGVLAYRYTALPVYRPFRCISPISPPPNAPLDSPLFFQRAHLPIYTISRRSSLLYRLPFYQFSARCGYTLLIANRPTNLLACHVTKFTYLSAHAGAYRQLARRSMALLFLPPPCRRAYQLYSVNKRSNRICHFTILLTLAPSACLRRQ